MAYIPHTEADVRAMLAAIGVSSVDDLFTSIPPELRLASPLELPKGLSEADTVASVRATLAHNRLPKLSFAGAGAYEHYIPAAVRHLIGRGEFLTAYTPYQPEASQGSLQTIFEFQTMIARLTGLDVANASLYDAGSAVAEAVVMAWRANSRTKVLVAPGLHPLYRRVLETYVRYLGITVEALPEADGAIDADRVSVGADVCAVVIQHPNVFGRLEPGTAVAAKARSAGALTIAVCNPVSLALLAPPGAWGADIAVGDVQPVGVPVAFGGPYAGFLAAKKELVRKMPGRIVGQTVDVKGRRGFVLTLQAREQHIRREKATSNICTNQALVALMFTVAAAMLGGTGLRRVAETCAARTQAAIKRLGRIAGVKRSHAGPVFHEFVLDLPAPADAVVRDCVERHGIVPGVPLARLVPGRTRELLVCVTETKKAADLDLLAEALVDSLARVGPREAVAR